LESKVPERPWESIGLEVVNREDFSGERLNRSGTYVVCFGAHWCSVTRRFMPKFVERKGQWPGTLAIADITEKGSPLWDVFRIRISPSILVFQDGMVVARVDGRRMIGIHDSAMEKLGHQLAAILPKHSPPS
jgi:thioredoxin-like negative regulator of GroEL